MPQSNKATTELSRADKIDRYVYRDALEKVIISLGIPYGENPHEPPIPYADNFAGPGEVFENIAAELSEPLFSELFPGPDDPAGDEWEVASVRSSMLAARLLAQLADSRAYLIAQAGVFMAMAERDLRCVGRPDA
jgi:hypothetical protein